jgi:uncharacterized protein (TIGR02145 family)
MRVLSVSPEIIFLLALFFCSCLLKPSTGNAQLPTVTTTNVTNITSKDATSGGSVISQGLTAVTARGVCWSSSNSVPTLADKVTISGSGVGLFKSSITGLTLNTTYFVRAFATNGSGTAYGAVVTFKAVDLAQVTTTPVTDITVADARAGGNVLSDGGSLISSRGICWSTSANPTVALTTKTSEGNTQGAFLSKMTGLLANTTYFVRAYVTTNAGTQYGAEISFRTQPTVTIGTQVWMQKNLNVARYRNGEIIPQIKDSSEWTNNLTTGAWCWYNNDSATYAATYGRLYNWYAVTNARGLCPLGWHVPTDDEWTILTNYLGGESVAGGKMKTTTGWASPNTGATNSSGFSGLPGGLRWPRFFSFLDGGYWWSSTSYPQSVRAWFRRLNYNNANVTKNYEVKPSGFSVRCIKD